MPIQEPSVVIQYRDNHREECLRFEVVPLAEPIHICIWQDSSAAFGSARALYDLVKARVAAIGQGRHSCNGPQGADCMARKEPNCRSVFVPVTGRAQIDQRLVEQFNRWNRSPAGRDLVIPVLPAGADIFTVLGPFDKTNAVFDHRDRETLADMVLQQAGFGGVERRVFISYRRADSQAVADQLFERVTQIGYDVYLDRFSGTPGRLFPDEINEMIVDKGLVLLLETSGISQSPWTLAEISFAFLHGLGLLAVNLENAPKMGIIPAEDRHSIPTGRLGVTSNRLGENELQKIVSFIRRRYAYQIMQRRLYLDSLLRLGLQPHGVTPQPAGLGMYEVNGGRDYRVALAERAPGIKDVRRNAENTPTSDHSVLLASYQYLAPERRRDFDWLVEKADVRPVCEGEVLGKCADMARGRL